MFKRPNRIGLSAGVAVAIVALGSGVALASPSAATKSAPVIEQTAAVGGDGDNVQFGDQTTPDTGANAAERAGAASEASAETTSDSGTGASDGSGGHADPVGNLDHQFSGNE